MKKLELKHIKAYNLGDNGIKMITSENQGEFTTPITQLDFNEDDLVYGNSYIDIDDGFYPYSLKGAKLLLVNIDQLTKEEAIELGWKDEEHLKRGIESEYITVKDQKYLTDEMYDIFGLIEKNLAVDINTLK